MYEIPALNRTGKVVIPPSKSDGQRAIVCAAFAHGTSEVTGIGPSADEQQLLQAVQALGAKVEQFGNVTRITGIQHLEKEVAISVGESGLACRLMGMISAAFDRKVTVNGVGSLLTRPMDEFVAVLGEHVALNEGKLPLTVCGPLTGSTFDINGALSSQFVSGLFVALALRNEAAIVRVNDLRSGAYLQMTLRTLSRFGVGFTTKDEHVFKRNQGVLSACSYQVEADWSSASYWLVAAALGKKVALSGLKASSLQADKALLNVLLQVGCSVYWEEEVLFVQPRSLQPFEFDATDCPDLFPALVALAAGIVGESKIYGTERLKHKESDRAQTLQQEFGKLGLTIALKENEMIVHGTGKLTGGVVSSCNDHRIAMSLAVGSILAEQPVFIEGKEAVKKSYPSFWDEWK